MIWQIERGVDIRKKLKTEKENKWEGNERKEKTNRRENNAYCSRFIGFEVNYLIKQVFSFYCGCHAYRK